MPLLLLEGELPPAPPPLPLLVVAPLDEPLDEPACELDGEDAPVPDVELDPHASAASGRIERAANESERAMVIRNLGSER
jgi:hypothetical protein